MPFQPAIDTPLNIDGVVWRVAEHPAAPGMPYGQEGRQATVYQILSGDGRDSEARAIKVFKPRFRLPTLVGLADKLARYGDLPGLDVCRRTVLTARRHTALLQEYPDLIYAVVMPWIDGPTWMEVLLDERELTCEQSLRLARALADVLSNMQEEGIAHCDLSGPNLIVPALAEKGPGSTHSLATLQLVDVEQMYGPDLDRPKALPGGSQGYAHRSAGSGLWEPNADRFAGAVLISEMLAWCDPRVRAASWGENYFDPDEIHRACERYSTLATALREGWGSSVAELFERAWNSETLDDCPTFGEWFVSLPDSLRLQPQTTAPVGKPAPAEPPTAEVPSTLPDLSQEQEREGVARGLMVQAARQTEDGFLGSALALYREALSLAPDRSRLMFDLLDAIDDLDLRVAQGEEASFAPQPGDGATPVAGWSILSTGRGTHPAAETSVQEPGAKAPVATAEASPPVAPGLAELLAVAAGPASAAQPAATAVPVSAGQKPATISPALQAATLPAATERPPRRLPLAAVGGGIGLLLVLILVALVLPEGGPLHAGIFGAPAAPTATQVSSNASTSPTRAAGGRVSGATSTPSTAQATGTVEAQGTAVPPTAAFTTEPAASATAVAQPGTSPEASVTAPGIRVNSIVFSPKGDWLATGVSDNSIAVISLEQGKQPVLLGSHQGSVTGLALSPDGVTLASSSVDQTVRTWDASTRELKSTLTGPHGYVTGVAFAPDGGSVSSSSSDGHVYIWSVPGSAEPARTIATSGPAKAVAYSGNGKYLAAGNEDGSVQLWALPTYEAKGTLPPAGKGILSLAFAPDGTTLAAGSSDGNIYVWSLADKQLAYKLAGHSGPITGVVFSTYNTLTLASASEDGTVRTWNPATGAAVDSTDSRPAGIPFTCLAVSRDGKTLAAGEEGGRIQLIDLALMPGSQP